jgi:MYXO-CTERM domain-containing protein
MRAPSWLLTLLGLTLLAGRASAAPYIGVTVGFSGTDLSGPYDKNIPLFNPVSGQTIPTWDDWVEEAAAAGVDYMAPDQRGYMPVSGSGDPHRMVDLVNVLKNRGLDGRIKLAIFDDNAASWTAQWNAANGRGFGYAQPFDISNSANWVYVWDYNYKVFYESVPDANRFKIDGRPVIIIWSLSPTFVANASGNASRMLTWLRHQAQSQFGFNPFIVASSDWLVHDPTSANLIDASQAWFIPSYTPGSYSVTTYNGHTIGVAVPSFNSQLLSNHGALLQTGLSAAYQGGAELTLIEGLTDWEESASLFRVGNLDSSGTALTYAQTQYDYPSQRLDVVRDFSSAPFPVDFKAEAEAADTFGGGQPGTKPNTYRNGDIDIESTTDASAGYDVTHVQAGEWLEWERVPLQGGGLHLTARVASATGGGKLHFVVDGQSYPSVDVPNTGGAQTWTTVDTGVHSYTTSVYHVVRLVADAPGFSVNYWQLSTDIGFRSGLEAPDPQPAWTDSADPGVSGGQQNVASAACRPSQGTAHYESSLKVSGTASGGATATYAYRVFDLSSQPVALDAESSLSYFIDPQQDNGRYVAVDLHFTDGTFLSAANLKDQGGQSINAAAGHGGGIPLGLWSLVTSDLSSLAGKRVDRIDVVFSRAGAGGDYTAYVDDILVTSGTKAPPGTTPDGGPADASLTESGAPSTNDAGNGATGDGGGSTVPSSGSGDAGSPSNGEAGGQMASAGCACRSAAGSGEGNAMTFLHLAWVALLASRRRRPGMT